VPYFRRFSFLSFPAILSRLFWMQYGFMSRNVLSVPTSCTVRNQEEGTLTVTFRSRFCPVPLHSCNDYFECEWANI
jgi:hypothetical protein